MESVCFNQFGRSPLVKHYLQKKRLHKVTGYSILTKRTELNQVIPSGVPTYEDVIRDSLKESREQSVRLSSQRRCECVRVCVCVMLVHVQADKEAT